MMAGFTNVAGYSNVNLIQWWRGGPVGGIVRRLADRREDHPGDQCQVRDAGSRLRLELIAAVVKDGMPDRLAGRIVVIEGVDFAAGELL